MRQGSKLRGLAQRPSFGAARFGRFELRFETDELLLDGRLVHVQPQPMRVLRFLVLHAGELVSRDTLRHALWDESTFVEFDQGLNYCIRQLRIALHDDAARPIYIETLKKQGYRFTAPVERILTAAAASAVLSVEAPSPVPEPGLAQRYRPWPLAAGAAIVGALLLVGAAATTRMTGRRQSIGPLTYRQLTNFSDAAFAPALSSDGRMLAFMVGADASFPPSGELFVKLLPGGEPLQLTHDGWPKYGPAFSPDGTEVAYTVTDASHGWLTQVVSPLGGDARLLLPNASGLVWLTPRRLMFAEIVSGLHMRLITATPDRAATQTVYLPPHERGMAHFGYPSPDLRSALVVEMGSNGWWQRCRLVPIDGHDVGTTVGPEGACTAAAWSPDGSQMYFTAVVDGESHVWRQRTAGGTAEQLTWGPTDEQGLAVSSDGKSLVTSVGISDSGVWMHDGSGEHLLSQDGRAARLAFSHDGKSLYYLLRRPDDHAIELRALDMASHDSRSVVSGLLIVTYDLSKDGSRVVMGVRGPDGAAQIWVAPSDGLGMPRMLSASGDQPCFGPDDNVFFRGSEQGQNYLFRMALDGSARMKAYAGPVLGLKGASPDKRWILALVPVDGMPSSAVVAISSDSEREARVCPAECMAAWSPDGSRFYVEPLLQGRASGTVVQLPVSGDSSLPPLPAAGISSADDARTIPGATSMDIRNVDPTRVGTNVAPAPAAGSFAYARGIVRRNLFELQLP